MPLTYFQPSQVDSSFNGYLRNRIINGAMMIDQRNAGAAVTANGAYPVDRFSLALSQASKLTAQQNGGGVTPPTGFTNYVGITSSSAYALNSTDYFWMYQAIEGLNVPDLNWGGLSPQTVTLSFWVRSSLTGTFSGSLRNSASNRSYCFTYTINGANTWEYKTITIAGDTTGTWLTTNGIGVRLTFALGSGSTRLGTANVWQAGDFDGATGTTSVVAVNGATWYVTGVQFEVGAVATPFERRVYPQELDLCQRYYQTNNGIWGGYYSGAASAIYIPLNLFTSMRTVPTVVFTASGGGGYSSVATPVAFSGAIVAQPTSTGAGFVNFNYTYTAAAEL